jgi:hypothetical protein
MNTVLLVDADTSLVRALCEELANELCRVIAHVRSTEYASFGADITVISAPTLHDVLARCAQSGLRINHVVFGAPSNPGALPDTDDDFESLIARTQTQLNQFLAELQAAGTLLVRGGGGQIWVLTQEDSMHYYTGTPSLPIDTRARHAAVKSFAKELFRFGVRINCANVQLLFEQATADEWLRAGDGLKAFAMKFKPNRAGAVARTLGQFLTQTDLPIAGMVIPVGIGFAEANF